MIQSNELRIGNWVTELIKNRIVSIDGIEPNKEFVWVNYLNGFGQYKVGINDIENIHLTPEILEKCGFEKEQNKIDIYTRGRLRLWIGARGSCLCYLVEEDTTTGHYIPKQVSYLHQLQNIYFSLTGEELDVKL